MSEELKEPQSELSGERWIKRLKALLLYYFFINMDGLKNSQNLTFPVSRGKTIPEVWSCSPAPSDLGLQGE